MLSKASVKKPFTVVVAVVLVMILGFVAFTEMTTDLLPNINLPYAIVMTSYPGASPEEVELTVTKPIEQSMATINNINTVSSVSRENVSMVVLEFNDTVNMDSVTIDIREKLDMIKGYWDDTVGSPTIMKLNPSMLPVMAVAVDVEGLKAKELSTYVSDKIVPSIESIEGVASIQTTGVVSESINVILSQDKIDALNKKIQNSVKDQLAEGKKKIEEARKELEKGKSELDKKTQDFLTGMLAGEQGIEEAKENLLKGEIELDEQEKELLKQKAQLEASETELLEKEKQLLELEKKLGSDETLKQEKEAKEGYDKLVEAEQAINAQLDPLILLKSGLVAAIETAKNDKNLSEEEKAAIIKELTPQLEKTEASIQSLKDTLTPLTEKRKQLETVLSEIKTGREQVTAGKKEIETAKEQIKTGKAGIEKGLTQIQSAKDSLENAKKTLNEKSADLSQQKDQVGGQLDDAKDEIEKGQDELEEQSGKIESQEDQALESADVTKMITREMISNLLMAQNFSMPAGYVTEEGTDYLVRVGDKFEDVKQLENLILFDMDMEGIDPIQVSDVADVFTVDNADSMYAKVNGSNAILLSIQKQNNFSTADVSNDVKDRFVELEEENKNIHATYLMDQGIYIDLVVDNVLKNLIVGGILAILVLLIFLRDIKPTFIIACSIPISVMFAIVLMYFSGVTLNIISLSGLAVGVGMLVDNSVVVIENIYRLRSKGVSAVKAAVSGAVQVGGAIIASTLTTVCVFAPIVFVKGITRQLFVDMALTIGYSLGASLIVALTLVPMMSSRMLTHTKERNHSLFDRFIGGYEWLLKKALRFKSIVLIGTVALLIFSIVAAFSQGTSFMPAMDGTQISVTMTMPKGSEMEETKKMSDDFIEKILTIEDVDKVGAMVSDNTMNLNGSTNDMVVTMYALLKEDKKQTSMDIAKEIEALGKDCPFEVKASGSNMDMGALGGSGISLLVRGLELDELKRIAKEVGEKVASVEGTKDVLDGLDDPTKEFRIIVDKDKAAKKGLTVAQAYKEISAALKTSTKSTTITYDGYDFSVNIEEDETTKLVREDIKNLTFDVTNPKGEKSEVKLSSIADFKEGEGLTNINRESGQRYIEVSAALKDGYNIGLVSKEVEKAIKTIDLPNGYEIEIGGESKNINESITELVKMLLLAIAFIYLIMVAQFQSLLSPFIVLFTIPLAFTGGLLGLFLTGNDVSIISMIGFVMLSGIIVNNGIVLVDYINQLRLDGYEKKEAIIEAGKTRMRPILMTAITTILGLSAMALGIGTGADMMQPIAIVTVGGLIYATLMTLFVVPVMYDSLNRKELHSIKAEDLEIMED